MPIGKGYRPDLNPEDADEIERRTANCQHYWEPTHAKVAVRGEFGKVRPSSLIAVCKHCGKIKTTL